jgi:multiple sugar transport system permease protein
MAFRPKIKIMARPPVWIPLNPTLDNFRGIFGLLPSQQGLPVGRYFIDSLVTLIMSTIVVIVIGMMGGYAFARSGSG